MTPTSVAQLAVLTLITFVPTPATRTSAETGMYSSAAVQAVEAGMFSVMPMGVHPATLPRVGPQSVVPPAF